MSDARVAVLLAPIDAGVINVGGRPGATSGPDAILAQLEHRGMLRRVDVHRARVRNTTDALEHDLATIAHDVHELCLTHDRVLVVGGDNGITYAAALGASRRAPLGGLAYVDVHWDLRAYPPHTSGSSFRRLLEERVLDAERLRPIGIERPADPAALARSRFDELERYAQRWGIRAIMLADAKRDGLTQSVADALAAWNVPRYLSIDLDAIDEREMPGVSAPGAGRFTLRDVVDCARAAATGVAIADVVELAPGLDRTGRSTRAAAQVAGAILEGWGVT